MYKLLHTKTNTTITKNRKAKFSYHIIDEVEAGIVLLGSEVKALRCGLVNIGDSFVIEKNSELYLQNLYIGEFKLATRFNHENFRHRKLLLKRREINKLIGKIKTKGITMVPLSLYINNYNIIKVKLGIAEGKKLYDKRETIKEREWQRNKDRIIKEGLR